MFFVMLYVLDILSGGAIYFWYVRPQLRMAKGRPIFLRVFAPTLILIMMILAAGFFWICDHHLSPWFVFTAGSAMGLLYIWGALAVGYAILRRIFHRESLRGFYPVFEKVWAALWVVVSIVPFIQGNIAPRWANLVLPINNWQGPPMKIVLLSDLHLGTIQGSAYLQEVVAQTNQVDPDLVVITGDILDHYLLPAEMPALLAPLVQLKPKWGTYFVLGNHDAYSDVNVLLAVLRSYKVRPLINENVIIDQRLNLAGVPDPAAQRWGKLYEPSWPLVEEQVDQRFPVVLLAHRPNFQRKIKHDLVDVMLMGHTHGGQIFPFSLLVYLHNDFFVGLYGLDHQSKTPRHYPIKAVRSRQGIGLSWKPEYKWYYVTPGTGSWGPPMRLLSYREITIITLKSSDEVAFPMEGTD